TAVPNHPERPGRGLSDRSILDILLLRGDWHFAVRGCGSATGAGLACVGAGRLVVAGPRYGSRRRRFALSRFVLLLSRHRLSPLPGEVCDPRLGGRAAAGCVWVCGTCRQNPARRPLRVCFCPGDAAPGWSHRCAGLEIRPVRGGVARDLAERAVARGIPRLGSSGDRRPSYLGWPSADSLRLLSADALLARLCDARADAKPRGETFDL